MRAQSILLVSEDAALCATARRNLQGRAQGLLRIAAVPTVAAARRVLRVAAPDVILLEKPASAPKNGAANADEEATGLAAGHRAGLHADVTPLAKFAPVVVIGTAAGHDGMATLLAAGAADYVERTQEYLPVALDLVAQRLQQ